MSEPYKTIDLFAGIGGMRRGFELTGGFQNVLSAEIDKYACATYKHLFGDDPYNDVTSESFKDKVEATPYAARSLWTPIEARRSRAGSFTLERYVRASNRQLRFPPLLKIG